MNQVDDAEFCSWLPKFRSNSASGRPALVDGVRDLEDDDQPQLHHPLDDGEELEVALVYEVEDLLREAHRQIRRAHFRPAGLVIVEEPRPSGL